MSYTKTTWVDNTTPIDENNLNKIESGIKNNDINIGEENYDNTKTYEVGDIVRYNEKIYKCITAITTAENFDISKWEQTNIVEIVQSEKSKIYELIEAISTPIVGEGENITLNDTAEKRFENFDIEGNSRQETREGYNKLPIKFANATNNGITLTVKDNGKLLLNGTSTSTALFNAVLDNEISLNNYIFKIKKNSGTISANNVQFFLYTTEYTSNQNISVTPILSSSKTTLSSNAYTVERIVIPAETTLTNVELEVMISETEKQYEPYGASPSPDYPSEVECCGDNINIFDGEVEEGNIDVSTGQNTAVTNAWRSKNYLNVKDTSVSISVKDLTFSGTVGRLYFYKSDNTYISNILINSLPFTATLPNETAKVRFFILNSVADINAKIKLEKGSTVTPYSPYGQGCINEVICNKNLINIEEVKWGAYYTATGALGTSFNWGTIKVKALGNTKYYLSGNKVSNNIACVVLLDKNKEFIEVVNNYTNTHLITTTSDTCYIGISIPKYIDGSADDTTTIMLEEKEILTSYEEHQSQSYTIPTQQPMRAIGDTRDKFILKQNGKWYERHNIEEVILTGDENWSQRNQGDGTNTITFNFNLLNVGAYGSDNVLCDKFVYEQNSSSGNEGIGFESTLVTQYIQINRNRLSSLNLAGFKEWISNNNIKVYYVLATPTDIECTSEQTEILNQIYIKAKSYKGITHIYSNDEVSPNCYVEAVKDLTTLIQ